MRQLLLVCCLLTSSAWAIDSDLVFEDPAIEARYRQLTHELRCLVCQNQSIAESNAGLAKDLRKQVYEMLHEGASDREILEFMTDRYGDFVRYRPALNQRTLPLWSGPLVVLLFGLMLLVPAVRRRSRMADEEEDDT